MLLLAVREDRQRGGRPGPKRGTAGAAPAREQRRKSPVLFGALGALVLAALYMFLSVSTVIEATAPDAQISLPGSLLTPGSEGRYLLWPGEYDVLIEAPDRRTL